MDEKSGQDRPGSFDGSISTERLSQSSQNYSREKQQKIAELAWLDLVERSGSKNLATMSLMEAFVAGFMDCKRYLIIALFICLGCHSLIAGSDTDIPIRDDNGDRIATISQDYKDIKLINGADHEKVIRQLAKQFQAYQGYHNVMLAEVTAACKNPAPGPIVETTKPAGKPDVDKEKKK